MSINKYREYAVDVFFNTYYLLNKACGPEGCAHFERLVEAQFAGLTSGLEKERSEMLKDVETGILAAREILEDLELESETNPFVERVWRLILQCERGVYTVAVGAFGFFKMAANMLPNAPYLLKDTISFMVQAMLENSKLHAAFFNTLVELATAARSAFTDTEFIMVLEFLEGNAHALAVEHCGMAMEALCSICTELDESKLPDFVHRCLTIPVKEIEKIEM